MMRVINWVSIRGRRALGDMLARVVGYSVASRYARKTGPLPDSKIGTLYVSGHFSSQNGISRGALQQAAALQRCGFDVRLVDASKAIRNPLLRSTQHLTTGGLVIHTGGPQLAQVVNYIAPGRNVRRIGYVAWELPDPPNDWRGFDRCADEIWAPSRFSVEALRSVTVRPVSVVRHVSAAPETVTRGLVRKMLGISDHEFLGLAFADLRSSLARKNPLGAITAFRKAFGDRRDVRLLIKLTAADREPHLVEYLRQAAGNANVNFLCDHLDDESLWSLFADADVFLSLHRAEGFGLPMLEAMSSGCTVIATNWSGNCDFMNDDVAAMLPYRLVDVMDPQGIYSRSIWAEPDLDSAVDWLLRLEADRKLCRSIGEAARAATTLDRQLADFGKNLPSNLVPMRSVNAR